MKNILLLSILLITSFQINAENNYVVIAEASIPNLTESVQSVSRFSDKVAKGSSLFLAGGLIALTFQLHHINISSDLRILLYADSSGENPIPLIAFIAKPTSYKATTRIKFNHHKFPAKKLGDRLFIAETGELLEAVKKLPPELDKNSAVTVKIYTKKYFSECAGTIATFKAKLEKEFSKGRKNQRKSLSGDDEAIESLLKQANNITLKLKTTPDDLTLNLFIYPEKATPLDEQLQKNQGILSQKDIMKLAYNVAKSENFNINDEISSAIAFILAKVFKNSDTKAIADKLCKFNISADKTKFNINIGITPKQAKDLLNATGVLNKHQ